MTTTVDNNHEDMDKLTYFDKTANSNTIKEKPTPSSELSKGDLLKILSYLEGEVQARDVVIATLKVERVKRLLADNKYSLSSSPFAALKRDGFNTFVNSSESKEDVELIRLWENQKISLENLISRQKHAMKHLGSILTDSEGIHEQMASELEDEKVKNASLKDGARLRDELEIERQLRARLEKELKESRTAHEEEKTRHKSIVLLLLNERKRILRQFVEERKRSADLALMLEEEKRHALAMAEGLEEESQKALRMESELERQASAFRLERERTANRSHDDDRRIELESHIKILRNEAESLRKQLAEAHSGIYPAPTTNTIINNSSNSSIVKKVPSSSGGGIRGQATPTATSQPSSTGIVKSSPSIHPTSLSTSTTTITTHNNTPPTPPLSNSLLQQGKTTSSVIGTPEKNTGTIIAAPKKYSLGRGVPPPVPPNKPKIGHFKNTITSPR